MSVFHCRFINIIYCMRPKGTIYRSGRSKDSGDVQIGLSLITRLSYKFLRGAGAGLTAFAVLSFLFAFGPIIQQEVSYQVSGPENSDEKYNVLFDVQKAEAEETAAIQKEAEDFGVNPHFSVVIPKIGAASNIIANVNTNDREEYLQALKQGVAHAKGTYFPGQGNKIFLFAHSTDSPLNIARYNAVFYLLRKLETGDKIIVYFADKKYIYEVSDKAIVPPTDTSWLIEKQGSETLVLLTCDPPGTTWNRLIIRAVPVD
jgi:LPXTG-site transpeptidase (sortase) family protein